MGGFGRKDTKQILYPTTLHTLLERGQLDIEELQLTEKEINDKSKGDILSKGLVAFQTTWFMFECLARLQQGLPLLELEVVALAFATLNSITYALWWYKPLNVLCPIYLHVRDNDPPVSQSPEADAAAAQEDAPLMKPSIVRELNSVMPKEAPKGIVAKGKAMVRKIVVALHGAFKGIIASTVEGVGVLKQDVRTDGFWPTTWKWLVERPFIAFAWPLAELLGEDATHDDQTHVSTFYAMIIPPQSFALVVLSSAFVGMVFGAIHFVSWNSTFLTHPQLLLWRICSVILVIQPGLLFLIDIFAFIAGQTPTGWETDATEETLAVGIAIIGFIGTIPYVFARFCVIFLAFLTLRDLPLGAFTNVSWTSYIPHF